MRWPLRNQIFVPFAILLAFSVLAVSFASAWNAAQQSRRQKIAHMHSVAEALGKANFPLNNDIPERIAAMIDGEVVIASPRGEIVASTLPMTKLPAELEQFADTTIEVNAEVFLDGRAYLLTVIPRLYVQRPGPMFVLLPQEDLLSLRRDAMLPPAIVGLTTLVLAMGTAMILSRRIGGRVNRLRDLFATLSTGQYQTVAVGRRDDELRDLMMSANELSVRLEGLQAELKKTERLDLLGQLSGGLAHQLRNSITGAKMAVQLHQQDCDSDTNQMLETAMSQLRLTEEQVMAVLSLRDSDGEVSKEREMVVLEDIVESVLKLVKPQCLHWKTDIRTTLSDDDSRVRLRSATSMKGAILNLVLNAIEAAGTGGMLQMTMQRQDDSMTLDIRDNGPGFSTKVGELTDAFQTTKREGIGLGLTIAHHAVQQEGGRLQVSRIDDWTSVAVIIPMDNSADSET